MYRNRERLISVCPLNFVEIGKTIEVYEIHGGIALRRRLAHMGIYPGVRMKVLLNKGIGSVMVAINEKRIGFGFGMCNKIIVRVLD